MRLARAPDELLDTLVVGRDGLEEAAVERARFESDERVIEYRFGTAEAEEVALLAGGGAEGLHEGRLLLLDGGDAG